VSANASIRNVKLKAGLNLSLTVAVWRGRILCSEDVWSLKKLDLFR